MPQPKTIPSKQADSLYKAFLALQIELDAIEFIKNAKGSTGKREYAYQDLPALAAVIKPVLRKHLFVWFTRPSTMGGQPSLKYALIYAPTGEAIEGEMLLLSKEASPQDQGAAITYARRYSITAVLDIVADEDDDASKADRAVKEAKATAEKPASDNKKGNIYVMLREVEIDPDAYKATLKANGIDFDALTNAQADDILQKLGAHINMQRAKRAATKTNVPEQLVVQ